MKDDMRIKEAICVVIDILSERGISETEMIFELQRFLKDSLNGKLPTYDENGDRLWPLLPEN